MSEPLMPAEREENEPSSAGDAPQQAADPYGGVALGVECAWPLDTGFDAH